MDLLISFDNYLNFPREHAYNLFLDEKNLKIFKVILVITALIFMVALIVNLSDNGSFNFSVILTFITIITLVSARIFYRKLFNLSNIRKFIFFFLIFQLLMAISIDLTHSKKEKETNDNQSSSKSQKDLPKTDSVKTETESTKTKTDSTKTNGVRVSMGKGNNNSYVQYILFFCILLLVFKFSRTEIIQLFSIGFGFPILIMLLTNSEFDLQGTIPNLIIAMVFFVIAFSTEKKRQKKFFDQYDFYYRKNYESLRMKKELNYAREIQLSMLPKNEAVISDLQISGISIPASEVGGDYFDYFKISETEVGIFICDVSGHGVASGLMLSGLRSCMHLILEDYSDPKEVIEKLNRMIRKTQNRRMFVTAIFAIIDLKKNKCILYNAGHLPPYKISGESKEIFKIKKHGIALGAMDKVEVTGMDNEVVFDFNKNDKIVFYTDGVNEAMNTNKTEYGLDNFERYLNNNSDKKTNELLKGLIEDIKRFMNNSAQRDDLTLLIVQRNTNEK